MMIWTCPKCGDKVDGPSYEKPWKSHKCKPAVKKVGLWKWL